MTNAHVVAGQDDTSVQLRGEGAHLDADPIWFDARNDLALLSVPDLAVTPALALNEGPSRAPQPPPRLSRERPLRRARRLGQTGTVVGDDAYGRGPVARRITSPAAWCGRATRADRSWMLGGAWSR